MQRTRFFGSVQPRKGIELRSSQVTLFHILAVLRRRKWLIVVPAIIVGIVCVVGAYVLPRKYESSTTIWVQKDEILNPLVSFTMAVQMASEDRLRAFNEIVYSRQMIEAIIDSLHINETGETAVQWDEMVDKVKANIKTERRGSDSFVMSYTDTDPVRAQRAVTLLASMFIQTRLRAESTRNDLTVDFFARKLKEYQDKFGETEETVVSLLKQRVQQMPNGSTALAPRLDAVDEKIREAGERIRMYQRAQGDIRLFPESFRTERGRQALAELQQSDLPYSGELRGLLAGYDSVTVRYTSKYPEVGKYESQIVELLRRVDVVIESAMSSQTAKLGELQKDRARIIEDMTSSSVAERVDQVKESNYGFYRTLYNDMKVKLEQAKIAQELGRNAENAFIIIDPARIPAKPTKPNRRLIIIGGFIVGIMIGFVSAGAAEMLDTTVRTPREIDIYHKPVIALIPEAISERIKQA